MIKLKYMIRIVDVGGSQWEVWKGDMYMHSVLSRHSTKGQAYGWAIDNGLTE